MNDYRVDARHLQKDNVSHDRTYQVRAVHCGSTDLNKKCFSPEALQVGQGFNQSCGFFFGIHRNEAFCREALLLRGDNPSGE